MRHGRILVEIGVMKARNGKDVHSDLGCIIS
jgi:hypothetical protein